MIGAALFPLGCTNPILLSGGNARVLIDLVFTQLLDASRNPYPWVTHLWIMLRSEAGHTPESIAASAVKVAAIRAYLELGALRAASR